MSNFALGAALVTGASSGMVQLTRTASPAVATISSTKQRLARDERLTFCAPKYASPFSSCGDPTATEDLARLETRLRQDSSAGLFIAGARVPAGFADPGWGARPHGFAHGCEQRINWRRQ